jgi:formylglycine-generating enzyme required for sulfatase activity
MAPEQYAGRPLDARADVFALGVIVCELVSGERPFTGTTMGQLASATEKLPAQLALPVWGRFPAGLAALVTRMLAHDPASRLRDGAALVSALAEIGVPAREVAPPRAPLRPLRILAWVGGLGAFVAAGVALEPRLAREIVRRRAVGKAAPFGMVLVDEGTLTVGQPAAAVEKQCSDLGPLCRPKVLSYQVPASRVTVAPFFLDVREVTNQEFVDVLNGAAASLHVEPDEDDHLPRYVRLDAGLGAAESFLLDLEPKFGGIESTQGLFHARPGRDRWPVNQVTWFGARFYCRAQGKRLPTEDEWEAAARGADDRPFPWGGSAPRCGQVLIPNDGFLSVPGCPETASLDDVGKWPQDVTPRGIRDLGGSVAEWVDAVYSDEGRDRQGASAPEAPRVFRGGSFYYSYMARTSVRNKRPGNTGHIDVGFRCSADVR